MMCYASLISPEGTTPTHGKLADYWDGNIEHNFADGDKVVILRKSDFDRMINSAYVNWTKRR